VEAADQLFGTNTRYVRPEAAVRTPETDPGIRDDMSGHWGAEREETALTQKSTVRIKMVNEMAVR
jgi:hypothetical protein